MGTFADQRRGQAWRCACIAAGLLPPLLFAQQVTAPVSARDLADLSLEQLSNLEVTTAARRPERLSDAAASIFVITREDIRRSGASSLPEALRLAPNLEVARVSATTYAITARGFQNVITNKLLVLLDGRTLYTTVLAGVLWDAQDVMLDDVDRIEVISGPGAALYGANAFAGVINIISRPAADTQGGTVVAGGGNFERQLAVRQGGVLGESGAWRAYAMHIERDNMRPEASAVADRMRKDLAGFRADAGPATGFTLQGDAYRATIDGNHAAQVKLNGANLTGNWRRALDGGATLELSGWVDRSDRDDPQGFRDRVDTYDLQFQHSLATLGVHRISYGAGYRYAIDAATPTAIVRFVPDHRRLHWASAFAQDEIALRPNLTATVGAKVQTDVYVNPEFLPDARLAWKPVEGHLLWTALSRVARTPGRIDRDFFFPGIAPFLIRGGPDFKSETGEVFEVGYRGEPSRALTVSATLFYDRFDNLRSGRPAPSGGGFVISNEIAGKNSGLEAWAMVQAAPQWRVTLGLLELSQNLRRKDGSGGLSGLSDLGNDPRHTVKLRSSYRLSDRVSFDADWRYVSALSYSAVPAYNATDLRLAWQATPEVEIAVMGGDVFHARGHVEFDEHGAPAVLPRTGYLQLRWKY